MTLAALDQRKGYWQDRLNLKEWTIKVRWTTPKERELHGLCNWQTETLTAEIAIGKRGTDHESTLIHELLHIVWQGHANYEEYDAHAERAINRIAAALTAAE